MVHLLANGRNSHLNGNHNIDIHFSVREQHLRCPDSIQLSGKHCAKHRQPAGDVFGEPIPKLDICTYTYRRRWAWTFPDVGSRRCNWSLYDIIGIPDGRRCGCPVIAPSSVALSNVFGVRIGILAERDTPRNRVSFSHICADSSRVLHLQHVKSYERFQSRLTLEFYSPSALLTPRIRSKFTSQIQ